MSWFAEIHHRNIMIVGTLGLGLATTMVALEVRAKSSCQVTKTVDDINVSNTLRWCVSKLNTGGYPSIDIAAGTYELKSPLTITGGSQMNGPVGGGVAITPSNAFGGGASLLEFTGGFKIFDVELEGNGNVADVRGIRAAGPSLDLTRVGISGFDTTGDGGGVLVEGGVLHADETNVSNCVASNGGGIAVDDAELALLGVSTVSDNKATLDGGGIYVDPGSVMPSVTVDDSYVGANEASRGGCIYATVGSVNIVDSEISGGQATGHGGGIYGTAVIVGSEVRDNVSDDQGGGIYAVGDITMETSLMFNNVGVAGGGLYVGGASVISIHRSTFEFNHATGEGGGALSISGGTSKVANSTFAHNQAEQNGGAIAINGGVVDFFHVTTGFNSTSLGTAETFQVDGGTVSVQSTLIAGLPAGTQCGGLPGAWVQTTSMATDNSCTGMTVVGLPIGGLLHDPRTPVFDTDFGTVGGVGACVAQSGIDQLDAPRPMNGCSVGALEVEPTPP